MASTLPQVSQVNQQDILQSLLQQGLSANASQQSQAPQPANDLLAAVLAQSQHLFQQEQPQPQPPSGQQGQDRQCQLMQMQLPLVHPVPLERFLHGLRTLLPE